jgi:hypothetical protein
VNRSGRPSRLRDRGDAELIGLTADFQLDAVAFLFADQLTAKGRLGSDDQNLLAFMNHLRATGARAD